MPDPRLMRQRGQRSWLRAFMLWTSLPLNPLGSHALLTVLDLCLFFMPDPPLLDPEGGGYLEPLVLLEPPAHNPGCSCVLGLTDSSGTFV